MGPSSSGKTTLLNHVAARLAAENTVLHCRGPKEDATAVLASLLLSADLAPWELSEVEQRNLLTVFIHQRRAQGRRVVVVIDDAHTLKPAAWEEIERLVAFRLDKRPAIELLIAGPRSLPRRIDRERTGLEASEIGIHDLAEPSIDDLVKYVEWRLGRFEMSDLITPKANQVIARVSGARYAAVDVLCQMSLLLLRQMDADRVDSRVAQQALATLVERQTAKLDSTAVLHSDRPVTVPPQGYLLISRSGKVLNRITLGQRTLLGRSEHNDVCLPSPYLGRHHAAIVGTPEGYYVIDLNSVNGLLVNGRQVERAILCDQDVLTIGPFRMKVQIPDWLAHGNPFPATDSLDDTAILPVHEPPAPTAIRVVK